MFGIQASATDRPASGDLTAVARESGGPPRGSAEREVIVRVEGLGKRFGGQWVLQGVDLEVRRAELFGVIGADGAGKTTLLRLLSGLLRPTCGRITLAGRETRSEDEALRGGIGYMAQQFSLYRDLTVTENLRFFADAFGVSETDRREWLPRLMAAARLADVSDRRAMHLSGGMQKKLALICALVHRPQVLLLDEPTTGVDPVSRREFWQILTDLCLGGMTVVLSTPYMEEADRCSRLAVLDRGRLLACGTPSAIRSRMPGRLFEVQLSQPDQGRLVLSRLAAVQAVERWGDALRVRTTRDASLEELSQALSAAGLEVRQIREVTPRMHEALAVLIAEAAGSPLCAAAPMPQPERTAAPAQGHGRVEKGADSAPPATGAGDGGLSHGRA